MPAPKVKLFLALWLLASAFSAERPLESVTNAWLVGLAVVLVSLACLLGRPSLRYGNLALSLWLLASVFIVPPQSALLLLNDAAIALAVMALSLVTGSLFAPAREPEPGATAGA